MPELPEVEIIRRGLEKYVVGSRIEDIEILSPKQFVGDPKEVIGAEIRGVRRFGKGLAIDLSNGFSIAIHFKMTGQLFYLGSEANPADFFRFRNKWTRAVFRIKNQSFDFAQDRKSKIENTKRMDSRLRGNDINKGEYSYLYYNDIRKFGWIRLVETDKLMELAFFKNLGPEPLRDLDFPIFRNILTSSKRPIKLLLMDQAKIAGLGNIYANEALFLARVHPLRSASSLTKIEAKRLLAAIEKVLRRGIAAGGASKTNYVNVIGEKGRYQKQFLVYGREGERCKACKSEIKRVKMGGRGTFYCPKCQK